MNDIHFTLGKHLLIFIHYYFILPLLGQWNMLNMPWLYSVEQGRNNWSDVMSVIFDFFFQ